MDTLLKNNNVERYMIAKQRGIKPFIKVSMPRFQYQLFSNGITSVELIILTLLSKESIMGTTFNDMTMIKNHDDVRILDGR